MKTKDVHTLFSFHQSTLENIREQVVGVVGVDAAARMAPSYRQN